MQKPTIGRIVLYALSAREAKNINAQIADGAGANYVSEGDEFPLIVARVWEPSPADPEGSVNGQVILDGTFTLWVTSVHQSLIRSPGYWRWPEIKPTVVDIKTMQPVAYTDIAIRVVTLSQLELRMRRLCGHIETLGASPALTHLSVECSNARQVLAALVEEKPLSPVHTDWLNGDHD